MAPLFRWDLLFPKGQHLRLFPADLDHRYHRLFRRVQQFPKDLLCRWLPVIHFPPLLRMVQPFLTVRHLR